MDQGDRKRRYGESTTYSRFLLAHNLHRDHLWEMHHKTAIAEGGHLCGIDGYITLCVWCHGRETAALARRRAKARKMGKPERTLFE
jgi:cytochrome c553